MDLFSFWLLFLFLILVLISFVQVQDGWVYFYVAMEQLCCSPPRGCAVWVDLFVFWVCDFVISMRGEIFFLFFCLPLETGRGGWWVGGLPFLHVSGRRCITQFVSGNLLSLTAYLLACSWTWIRIGGIEASISSASVGVIRNAAHIRHSALLAYLVCPPLTSLHVWDGP